MSSNVGSSNIYEAGDQRTYKQSELNERERYNEGNPNSHLQQDSKDNRTLANKLAREEMKGDGSMQSEEQRLREKDATLPARAHGNELSRGAKIDQELREEDEEYLRQKGKK